MFLSRTIDEEATCRKLPGEYVSSVAGELHSWLRTLGASQRRAITISRCISWLQPCGLLAAFLSGPGALLPGDVAPTWSFPGKTLAPPARRNRNEQK
jgi:hypothetical protein